MKHAVETLVKRTLLVILLATGALAVGCVSGAQDRDVDAGQERLSQLQQDIDLLREFNRLELTKAQLQGLVAQVDALHEAMRARDAGRLDIMNQLQALLEEQRAALLRDESVPPAVSRQIDLQVEKLQAYDEESEKQLVKFAQPIKDLLKPEQLDILTWVSEARLQAIEYLDWARTMSDDDFKAEAEVNAEGLAEKRDITKVEILDIYRTARAMSEEEYQRAKGQLADRLVPAFRDDSLPLDLVLIRRLQPDRVPIVLKEKLAQMK